MTFETIYLPAYDRVLKKGQTWIAPKADRLARAVAFDERWRIQQSPRLWQRFLALETDKDFLAFAKRYGVLGLGGWNPLASPEMQGQQNKVWGTMQSLLSSQQSAYLTREAKLAAGPVSSREQAMERCPTCFQWWLWQEEPIAEWAKQQNGLTSFVVLLNSLGAMEIERHGDRNVKASITEANAAAILDALTQCLLVFAAVQGFAKPDNFQDVSDKYNTSPPRDRVRAAMMTAQSIAGEVLLRSGLTVSLSGALGWQFDAKPQTLLHYIYLDFLFDMVVRCGGLMKPCDNQGGRKPCPSFTSFGQKYCSVRCKNAAAKRAERRRRSGVGKKNAAVRNNRASQGHATARKNIKKRR
mgnify:CR=1 FL=1